MRAKQEKPKRVDKKTLSFFLIGFPTLIIVANSMISPGTWWVNIILAVYQFVMLKQFLDDYYNVL